MPESDRTTEDRKDGGGDQLKELAPDEVAAVDKAEKAKDDESKKR